MTCCVSWCSPASQLPENRQCLRPVMNPLKLCRDVSLTCQSGVFQVNVELDSVFCPESSVPPYQILNHHSLETTIFLLLALLHAIMQRDFFQSSGGVAVGNLGLSVKYFIARNGIISVCLNWCFAYCNNESFLALCFLESQLKPHCIFIWGDFLYPVPLRTYKLGKRVRHDQVTDAPGCCAFSCPVCVSMECETAETTLQWNSADLLLCLFWAQLALIYWWRVIHDELQGLSEASDTCVISFGIHWESKIESGEKIFPCVCEHS